MQIDRLDHLVLTVANVEKTCDFYTRVLGMKVVTFGTDRKALTFGNQKINLHQLGSEIDPKAIRPTPGSADLCFISRTPVAETKQALDALGIQIEEGPVPRTGATGPIISIYIRNPDQNLVEISNHAD